MGASDVPEQGPDIRLFEQNIRLFEMGSRGVFDRGGVSAAMALRPGRPQAARPRRALPPYGAGAVIVIVEPRSVAVRSTRIVD
jgi:hypothetical protein